MFDLSELKNDRIVMKELPVSILDAKAGDEQPVVIIEISDRVRKEEAKLAKQHNRFFFRGDGTEFVADKIGYLQGMTDICVKDSQRLFVANGRPAEHDNKAFKTLLLRYPAFASWFADALTAAFADAARIKADEDAQTEKNS